MDYSTQPQSRQLQPDYHTTTLADAEPPAGVLTLADVQDELHAQAEAAAAAELERQLQALLRAARASGCA